MAVHEKPGIGELTYSTAGFVDWHGMAEPDALLAAGNDALNQCLWQEAHEAFERALGSGEVPEAYFGLASAVWWLGDMPQTVAHLEKAYAGFQKRPEPMYAAASAIRLAFHYGLHLGNGAAAAGWIARATRLVDAHQLEPLRGELVLTRACLSSDAELAADLAREALTRGRDAGDPDLELCAIAELGTALVDQGRIEEGVALLDEAMAACLAGDVRVDTVAFTSCLTMVSCANCADFERATQWLRAMERFVERYGSPFHNAECRVVHADVMLSCGSWAEAETVLRGAVELAGEALPSHRDDALALLAELRLGQGRVEEAAHLLSGLEATRRAVPALCRLYLAQQKPALAATTAQRRLDLVGTACLESGRLLELLGEAEIALDDAASAAQRGATLADLGTRLGCELLAARGERLRGRALLHSGDAAGRRHLDRALAVFTRLRIPYEAARTRRLIAEALRADRELAATEARSALATFDELGARDDSDACAALLRSLGVRVARGSAPAARAESAATDRLTRREQEVLALLAEGLSNPAIASRLHVSRKTVEHHVAHILEKLGLQNRAEAAAEAVRRAARR